MDGPAGKYSFDGIGAASATIAMAAFATNPATAFLAVGFVGKIVSFVLTKVFSMLASVGLVLLNVGAERIGTIIDQHNFDGSFDTAEKLIDSIRKTGRDLTPEEVKAIDDPVIGAFRKWASFARDRQ